MEFSFSPSRRIRSVALPKMPFQVTLSYCHQVRVCQNEAPSLRVLNKTSPRQELVSPFQNLDSLYIFGIYIFILLT
jgi:hypothetical protein